MSEADGQPPIGAYGLLGDGRTAALSSSDGSIDWLCLPRFDSDPVFARLVDPSAGRFSIEVDGRRTTSRRYRPGSAVVETTWETATGRAVLTEGMVSEVRGALLPRFALLRRLEARDGPATVRVTFDPREGFGGPRPRSERRSAALVCTTGSLALGLTTAPDLELAPGESRTVTVPPGSALTMVMAAAHREPLVLLDPGEAERLIAGIDAGWRRWSDRIEFDGPHADAVLRSLITLRLLTFSPSGAPVAAPTTSLPEVLRGDSNWDYRYSWPRDASLSVEAFLGVGVPDEAHSYVHWLLHATRLTRPKLRVLYTVDGKEGPEEREVHVAGYRGSTPVRIGNAANEQHQLDVYGWVLGAAWKIEESGERNLHGETWRAMADVADEIARRWREPDAGIWEVRGPPEPFVHSKLMACLALSKALALGRTRRLRDRRRRRWAAARDALAAEIRERGWDDRRSTYVASYGKGHVDAAVLLPLVEFEDPDSPRLRGTIDAVTHELSAGGPLLYRHPPDTGGSSGPEGAFLACSFWLVQALAHVGERERAEGLMSELVERATDLGLYAEEMDPTTGEQMGNFPQGLTHAALVQAAVALAEANPASGTPPAGPRTRRGPPA